MSCCEKLLTCTSVRGIKNTWTQISNLFRISEWLVSKVCFNLAFILGYLLVSHVGAERALMASAVYISYILIVGSLAYFINDLGDRKADKLAGKTNFSEHLDVPARILIVFGLLVLLVLSIRFSGEYMFWYSILIGLQILLVIAYSLKPLRLKTTYFGVFADALFSYVMPALIALSLMYPEWKLPANIPGWGFAFLAWLFLAGLRSIISHQLGDVKNDMISGMKTFVVRAGVGLSQKLRMLVVMLEITVLAGLFFLLPGKLWYVAPLALTLLTFTRLLDGTLSRPQGMDDFLEQLNDLYNFHFLNAVSILLVLDYHYWAGIIPLLYFGLHFRLRIRDAIIISSRWVYYKWQGLLRRLRLIR
ncbi:MAG TPA: hypothetical protein VJ946_06515, partial [Bacteroidales bacterium]|nr:hypothetical protein [Bacteroidales bacterium]